ncbi:MAG: tryptophan 2,3-dioxygenase family protein [Emcibacteraceae bacterium]|jgi:tryptophan 2,3-dioxygenase|nr:tryptophan 2,3-dioxygenase [Kordiimonadaceae bacterium]MDG1021649.1 tryptophan 2,3-dioxygenase family protein [Emcibacteraceae bacterium]MDG1727095.1 tryptophan 2,3-dioxygenase family protein [Emcibacteraceae bacterium]
MSFEFVIPEVVDPNGVDGSPHPRPMDVKDDQSREEKVLETDGEPITNFYGNSNPYIDYESVDLLLSLQHPRSQGYDEMCFIIMGQAKELLFKSLYFELYNLQLRIRDDDIANAFVIMDRSKKILKLIVNVWDVLSTIRTDGFNQFRDYLSVASGQLSFMYRHIEFILGNKNKHMCEAHSNVPHVYPALLKNFSSPSIYDDVIRLLARNEFAIDAAALDRDWTEVYKENASVEAAWLKVYSDPTPTNELYMLGEGLTELADIFSQYRHRHFVSVERILGFKPGTGGSAGVGWLKKAVDHRFFPELWTIRTEL